MAGRLFGGLVMALCVISGSVGTAVEVLMSLLLIDGSLDEAPGVLVSVLIVRGDGLDWRCDGGGCLAVVASLGAVDTDIGVVGGLLRADKAAAIRRILLLRAPVG